MRRGAVGQIWSNRPQASCARPSLRDALNLPEGIYRLREATSEDEDACAAARRLQRHHRSRGAGPRQHNGPLAASYATVVTTRDLLEGRDAG